MGKFKLSKYTDPKYPTPRSVTIAKATDWEILILITIEESEGSVSVGAFGDQVEEGNSFLYLHKKGAGSLDISVPTGSKFGIKGTFQIMHTKS